MVDSRKLVCYLDQSTRLHVKTVDFREDGGCFLEVTAVHVASVQVRHLPVHPGHLSTPVGAELQGSQALVRIVETNEHRSRIGISLSENFPEEPRCWDILVFIEKDVFLIVVNITVLKDPMSAGVDINFLAKTEDQIIVYLTSNMRHST